MECVIGYVGKDESALYLAGYNHGTRNVHQYARLDPITQRPTSYARGKGHIKNILSIVKKTWKVMVSDYDRGYLDAYLDSVN